MSEIMKDSAIKLFGKTITFSEVSLSEHRQSSFATSDSLDSKEEHESTTDPTETLTEATSSEVDDESNTNDSNTPDGKTLKKPDKIIPCPRCNSTVTKFCYFNNYNVNQPRYFCKNCQRYWTSGGTMRNVPVGSGRRKTKNIAVPTPHHMIVSNALQSGFFIGSDSGFPVSFYPAQQYWAVPSNLGKHSREEEMERSMWVPKTLRIHDPSEAAKSSIWTTLGRIKNEKTGLFRAFETKGDRIVDGSTMVRQANPAALSRSINFQEGA